MMKSLAAILILSMPCCAALNAQAGDDASSVWLVSTRSAPHCGDLDAGLACVRCWRLDEQCQWSAADAEQFHADDDPRTPTVIYIHGNRTDADEAVTRAMHVYRSIRAATCGKALRFVIWSWPAEPAVRGLGNDARLKTSYCDDESHYLAQWMDRLAPGVRVGLVGHSYGARIITGALHLLGGGELAGRNLSADTIAAWREGKRNPVRAVLMAAAIDADWLAAGGCHGRALPLVDQMLVARNGCDWLLRRYSRLFGRGGPPAMGAVGPCLDDGEEKVSVVDVSGEVRRIHDLRRYIAASGVCCRWARYTFMEDRPAQTAP
jgi:hypothetical protein